MPAKIRALSPKISAARTELSRASLQLANNGNDPAFIPRRDKARDALQKLEAQQHQLKKAVSEGARREMAALGDVVAGLFEGAADTVILMKDLEAHLKGCGLPGTGVLGRWTEAQAAARALCVLAEDLKEVAK
jgi:hypothetical protein